MGPKTEKHHHHILPTKVALTIGGTLLVLTAVTVGVAHIDLGRFNFFIAMVVATIKALLVALFFMNLIHDRRENGVIFATSFLFLAIFIILTSTDLFFRGDVYVKGPLVAVQASSKLTKPWISTPELVAHGRELYSVQCVACHGAEGKGNGPAASALNPHPRNFTATEGWKNGRKPTMVFKTLKEGLPPSAMASYATLPADDRWALTHFVLSLASNPETDTPADFAKIGINPNEESVAEKVAPTIPLSLAMRRVALPESPSDSLTAHPAHLYHPEFDKVSDEKQQASAGARLYQAYCVRCHGAQGEGGIKVAILGATPVAYVTTEAFKSSADSVRSFQTFSHWVTQGLPGDLMPAFGQLSSSELQDLFQFVHELTAAH